MAPEEGIEPPLTVLETVALPLYYSGIKLGGLYGTRTRGPLRDRQVI